MFVVNAVKLSLQIEDGNVVDLRVEERPELGLTAGVGNSRDAFVLCVGEANLVACLSCGPWDLAQAHSLDSVDDFRWLTDTLDRQWHECLIGPEAVELLVP